MPVYFIDGNHENHPLLLENPVELAWGARPVAPMVYHLPRGYVWKGWGDVRYAALGGAVSVDKHLRQPGIDWFPEEEITEKDLLALEHNMAALRWNHIDVMFTHDCPDEANPPFRRHAWPEDRIRAAENHRKMISQAVEIAKPMILIHGHYHCHYRERLDGRGPYVIGLAQEHQEGNFAILDTDTMTIST